MSWRGRGKGSSDMVKRGSAFRPNGGASNEFELFPSTHSVLPPLELSERSEQLVNHQRVLVNHMLNQSSDEFVMRVHLGAAENNYLALNGKKSVELWQALARDVGMGYYPKELMTDSKSVLLSAARKAGGSGATGTGKGSSKLAALENSESKGGEGEGEADQSPRSAEVESESDESLGGEDYNVRFDYEDEGARDDYDDGGDDGNGRGDYGGEF